MITYSQVARIAGSPAEASAWAHRVAALVTRKTGVTMNVSARVGGPQELMWISLYEDFATFEASQAAIGVDPEYVELLRIAQEKGLFEAASIDTAFWVPI
jgi:hypothetical protein